MEEELNEYYCLYEAENKDNIFKRLDSLYDEGKIDYSIVEDDIIRIEDLDLSEKELINLIRYFDKNSVLPYFERDEEDDQLDYDIDFIDYDDF